MNIFDTHCHYNLDPLVTDWRNHWQQAQKKGIKKTLIPGASLNSSQKAIELARQDLNLFSSVAIHPEEAGLDQEHEFEKLVRLARDNNITAIGETGLDYFYLKPADRETKITQQQELFTKHIALANELKVTLIVHVRDKKDSDHAYQDALNLIQKEFNWQSQSFILHCVSGNLDYINQALKMNAYISLAGNVTYPNADQLGKIATSVPKDRLLVETDAPFLAPQEFRGKTNLPWMITSTVQFLDRQLLIDAKQLWHNAHQVFNL